MSEMQRIVVVGVSGAGKTTFARQLALQLSYPHIEMDAIHWLPDWVEMPIDPFRDQIAAALSGDSWVVDGNYSKVRDIVWSRADTIIWLDYALPLILARLFRRTVRRVITREVLWSGNRETLQNQFRYDSIIVWALRSYFKQRRTYPLLFQQPQYAHVKFLRLNSPKAAQTWLDQQR